MSAEPNTTSTLAYSIVVDGDSDLDSEKEKPTKFKSAKSLVILRSHVGLVFSYTKILVWFRILVWFGLDLARSLSLSLCLSLSLFLAFFLTLFLHLSLSLSLFLSIYTFISLSHCQEPHSDFRANRGAELECGRRGDGFQNGEEQE